MLISACAREQANETVNNTRKALTDTIAAVTPSVTAATPSVAAVIPSDSQPRPAKPSRYLNAEIRIDTLTREPRIESRDSTWILHLPLDMARVLDDSLPGLKAHELVIGDFNGDSRQDVAIDADAGTTSAFVIVLSKSDSVPQPRLFFVWKGVARTAGLYTEMRLVHPREFPGDHETTDPYTLRTDAVVYGYEMAATIYFIEKGELRSYSIAD
ncbi:MAG: hypothetical protein ACXU9O_15205 [Gemmatimonadaceae bacterium]